MAESMINRIAMLYKKAKSSAWGRTFKSDSERNFYIAEYLVKNDVVKVVRCKDCKMATEDILLEGFYLCEKDLMLYGADHFCNYGKRKEVANNG